MGMEMPDDYFLMLSPNGAVDVMPIFLDRIAPTGLKPRSLIGFSPRRRQGDARMDDDVVGRLVVIEELLVNPGDDFLNPRVGCRFLERLELFVVFGKDVKGQPGGEVKCFFVTGPCQLKEGLDGFVLEVVGLWIAAFKHLKETVLVVAFD